MDLNIQNMARHFDNISIEKLKEIILQLFRSEEDGAELAFQVALTSLEQKAEAIEFDRFCGFLEFA
jgi:acyl-[acyl carrier protein]--UDP-N-acetylglucosamine O-acyltransferase